MEKLTGLKILEEKIEACITRRDMISKQIEEKKKMIEEIDESLKDLLIKSRYTKLLKVRNVSYMLKKFRMEIIKSGRRKNL